MDSPSQSAQLLAACAGVLLSLTAAYVPGFSGWYQGLAGAYKRLLMLGLLAGTGLLSFGVSCARQAAGGAALPGFDLPLLECSRAGAWRLLAVFLSALVANQATYLIAVTGGGRGAGGEAGGATGNGRRVVGSDGGGGTCGRVSATVRPAGMDEPPLRCIGDRHRRDGNGEPGVSVQPRVKGYDGSAAQALADPGGPEVCSRDGAADRPGFDLDAAIEQAIADLERVGVLKSEPPAVPATRRPGRPRKSSTAHHPAVTGED